MLGKMRVPTGDKELKVKIPHTMLLQRHSMKIIEGGRIQDTVVAALQEYFEKAEGPRAD